VPGIVYGKIVRTNKGGNPTVNWLLLTPKEA
jgi:hypothetical protein